MTDNLTAFLTITGMGVVTYATRASGFFISSKIRNMPKSVRSLLAYIPGTIIISIIAPQMAEGGFITLSASVLCIAVSLISKNLVAAMAGTVIYVSILRYFI